MRFSSLPGEPTAHVSPSSWVLWPPGCKVVLLHHRAPRATHDGIFCRRRQAVITRDFLALVSVNLSVVGLSTEPGFVMLWRSRFSEGLLFGLFLLCSVSLANLQQPLLCQLVSRGSIWKLKETVWPKMRDKCSPFSISEKTSGQIFSLSHSQQLLLLYPSSLCNFPVVLAEERILCTSVAASFEWSRKFEALSLQSVR